MLRKPREWGRATLAERLRWCCDFMGQTSPNVVSELSLTVSLKGEPGSALSVLRLADRIVEEYGLRAISRLDGGKLTLKLARRDSRDGGQRDTA